MECTAVLFGYMPVEMNLILVEYLVRTAIQGVMALGNGTENPSLFLPRLKLRSTPSKTGEIIWQEYPSYRISVKGLV